jgi:H+-translocating NAD(P) transhydrogenase subunit beta
VIPVWAQLAYLLSAVCFILALKQLSSPRTARQGSLVGAAGAALAVVVTFFAYELDHLVWIVLAVLVGAVAGTWTARAVAMTQMPQLVALFNGVGGAAAALVALLELHELGGLADLPNLSAIAFAVLIGSVSFSGSMLTFAKLQELMTTRPVVPPGGRWPFLVVLGVAVVLAVVLVVDGALWLGLVLGAVSLALGILLVLPVGGADVPIVISLLNAFTGLAVAASGYLLENTLLLVGGTLVGASGTILTRAMASAMGRSVGSILFGALQGGSTAGSTELSQRPVRSAGADDVAILLAYARRVVLVPGYGLAVAQAQHTIHELAQVLEGRGVEVVYAIHPVAGRMPGHMNVLLAEANVPYEQLHEMDQANGELRTADVALVVGANDVVNPAARTSTGSPIYGMPILDADHAQAVVFLKRSMRPGFAGIENELLFDARTTLMFGDAKESLTALIAAVKSL